MTTVHQTTEKLLSLSEAAKIAGRSYAWAWNCAADGRLHVIRRRGCRAIQVTANSLVEALRTECCRSAMAMSGGRRRRRTLPALRLIIDNTK